MVDRDDDRKLGLKSSAILFGRHDVLAVMICYCLFIATMVWVGYVARLGAFYFCGVVVTCMLVAFEFHLICERQRERCFKAFLFNNWIGAALFAGIAADYAVFMPLFPGPAIGR
jgi:4-hydroxybenzoate polyprenyltransferase